LRRRLLRDADAGRAGLRGVSLPLYPATRRRIARHKSSAGDIASASEADLTPHIDDRRRSRGSSENAIRRTGMYRYTTAAAATAAFFALFGQAQAQEAAMQHMTGAATMPEACEAAAAPAGHDMAQPTADMGEHQAAMMQGMMTTSDQMMQGIMADDADVAFACGMIPHHQAAINMAEVELEHGDDQRMKDMAQMIIDAQTREIEQLTTWIEENAP
jgi:hypothetical protein